MLTTKMIEDVCIITFPANLGTTTTNDITFDLLNLIESNSKLKFDMESVNFISSMFIRFCLKALKEKGQDNFHIINVSPQMKLVFKIAGLDNFII